ncbi:MAG: GFA family protein [Pseudomonadota bacterium]|nr:GFA family protein [Pseudomonadota bacterium]
MMSATGQCLCGAVTYIAKDVHYALHSCHCKMCQRWYGGPAFAAPVGSITFNGEEFIRRYNSSDWAERGFCKNCGTGLFFRMKETDRYFVGMGTFDDLALFKLSGEIYIEHKPSAYDFVGDHPRMTGEEFTAFMQKLGN